MTAVIRSSDRPLAVLKRELSSLGLRTKDILSALPDWWEDAIDHPSGVFEIKGFAAKYFGLEVGPDGQLRQRALPHACFKARAGTDVTEITTARAMATAVAKVIASATNPHWQGALPPADAIRSALLEGEKKPWVGLQDLLDICWTHGVPVIYLPDLLVTTPKMEGMVTFCGGRPVILVTKKISHPAWMLFILAHEMGHIASGHLAPVEGGAIVDEKVSEGDSIDDLQEHEANNFALQLLTGGKLQKLHMTRAMKAEALATAARTFGAQHHIDPGHVVLNAVSNTRIKGNVPWGLANLALRYIEHDGASAELLCRNSVRKNIDLTHISDDGSDFLRRLGAL